MTQTDNTRFTYRDAGVDVSAGELAVELMKQHVRRTFRPEVLTDIGGFGGLFALQAGKYRQPVLVAGADGVGTKLKIAFALDLHDSVGIDCVAMSVNDVLVQGAEPLFFLDYLATSSLEPYQAADIVKGVAEGCAQAGCALLGGETAEMPGFYPNGEYDLAGFAVGVVERDKIIDGKGIVPGDAVIGLASSGLHSNGYSLVRRLLLEQAQLPLDRYIPEFGRVLGEELLVPTRIYVKTVLELLNGDEQVKGMAHITGGGLTGNIPRMLPEDAAVVLRPGSWPEPPVFRFIRETAQRLGGTIAEEEMRRTFNLGVGLVMVVPGESADSVVGRLRDLGQEAWIIGEVVGGERQVVYA